MFALLVSGCVSTAEAPDPTPTISAAEAAEQAAASPADTCAALWEEDQPLAIAVSLLDGLDTTAVDQLPDDQLATVLTALEAAQQTSEPTISGPIGKLRMGIALIGNKEQKSIGKTGIIAASREYLAQLHTQCSELVEIPPLPAWDEAAEGARLAGLSQCEAAFEFVAGTEPIFIDEKSFEPTMRDCADEAEWRAALNAYPRALGQSAVTRSDVDNAHSSLCKLYPDSPAC